jgi:two-component system chemotaxis response regulator CheB
MGFVVIGASLGGLDALSALLGDFTADIPLAFAVVQHRHQDSSAALETILAKRCRLPIVQTLDREPIRLGHVYLAPADYHLLVDDDAFSLSLDEPVNWARPSIDVLFESAAASYKRLLIGVLLTASTEDGAAGIEAVRNAGGVTIVQDPKEARSPVAPLAALARTPVDHVLRLKEIGPLLGRLAQKGVVTQSKREES